MSSQSITTSQVMGLSPKCIMIEQIGNRLPKLNESNYIDWRTKFKTELKCLKILHYLTTDPPTENKDEWDFIDGQICRIILTKAPLEFVNSVENLDTSKEIWAKIIEKYEKVTAAKRRDILKEWCTYQIKPTSTIEDHLKEYKKLSTRMDEADCKISEELKVLQLFSSLPESFHTFVASTIIQSGEAITITLEEAFLKIKAYHKFDTDKQNTSSPVTALQSTTNSKKGQNTPKKPKNPCVFCKDPNHYGANCPKKPPKGDKPTCYTCGKLGHKASDCPEKHTTFNTTTPQASHVNASEDNSASLEDDSTHAMTAKIQQQDREKWIFDTGASKHMTNNKDVFLTYHEYPVPDTVHTATDESATSLGEGTIKLRMKIKDKEIMCTVKA
jgi:hypothetical protein